MEEKIKEKARELGFDILGICEAQSPPHYEQFLRWIALGYHAGMEYMERTKEKRVDVKLVMPGVESILVGGINYYSGEEKLPEQPFGRIARYAVGRDYHLVLREKWEKLAEYMTPLFPALQYKILVDSGPILERDYASLAGLGFIGKNTCLIHPRLGSWLFLGVMLVNVKLTPDAPFAGHLCGTCRRCIDACPTGAIREPWVLDANKCISYWTIEHKGDFEENVEKMVGNWLFGCDICQEVCPWNRKSPPTSEAAFLPHTVSHYLPLSEAEMEEPVFRVKFRESPIKRVKWRGWMRNLKAVKKNAGESLSPSSLK
ncbi:MAG: tRNA epoxyqueuosine(34) reductase QueG [bacterium JZ-2024 1]